MDDGSGERTLWRVELKLGMVQVEDDKGIYYAKTCYVMLYKYGQGRGVEILYVDFTFFSYTQK